MLNAYTLMMVIVVAMSFLMGGNEKGNRKFIYFAFIAMFSLMAFRDVNVIGSDSTSSYLHAFQAADDVSIDDVSIEGFNVGFNLLLRIANVVFFGNYQLFIITLSAFFVGSFSHMVRKYSPSPITSICAYWGLIFYMLMFDALKQAVAMSILIYALDAIVERKPRKFYVLVILATLFHTPSIVFGAAYIISRLRIRGSQYPAYIVLSFLVVYLYRSAIIKAMMGAYRYNELADTYAAMDVRFIGGSVIVYTLILIICYILRNPDNDKDLLYTTLFKFMIVAAILQTFCYYNNIFKRLADYYAYFSVILIPLAFEERTESYGTDIMFSPYNRLRHIGTIMFCSYGIYYFANYVNINAGRLLPFKFCW